MQGQRAAREYREVQRRDEQWDRGEPALADDLAAAPDPVERDQHPRPGLVPSTQDQEGVVGEARVVDAEQAQRSLDVEVVDEAHDDVGIAPQRPPDRPELAVDCCGIAGRRSDHAHAGEPVQVVVDGGAVHGAHWLWPDARSSREIVPLERDGLLWSLSAARSRRARTGRSTGGRSTNVWSGGDCSPTRPASGGVGAWSWSPEPRSRSVSRSAAGGSRAAGGHHCPTRVRGAQLATRCESSKLGRSPNSRIKRMRKEW